MTSTIHQILARYWGYSAFRPMQEEIIPRLKRQFQVNSYLRRDYLVTGYSESALASHLALFEDQLPAPFSLAYLPSYGSILLRLSAWGEEHASAMDLQGCELSRLLGNNCITEGNKKAEEMLGELLCG